MSLTSARLSWHSCLRLVTPPSEGDTGRSSSSSVPACWIHRIRRNLQKRDKRWRLGPNRSRDEECVWRNLAIDRSTHEWTRNLGRTRKEERNQADGWDDIPCAERPKREDWYRWKGRAEPRHTLCRKTAKMDLRKPADASVVLLERSSANTAKKNSR